MTFEGAGFAVLSFLPQIAIADLNAEELSSCHRNIDMDEVMLTYADDDPPGAPPRRLRVHAAGCCARR